MSFFLNFSVIEWALTGILVVTFFIQLSYYLGRYARIPVYRQKVNNQTPPISVVVMIDDNMDYVQETLPRLLAQEYDPFEVVVVDNGSSVEVTELLKSYAFHYPNLKYTRINPDPKYAYRRKFVLTVGIKACSYPNILFTEPNSRPVSEKWLSLMAKGFTTGEVVIGYCGIEPAKGLVNKLIRCSRLMLSVRYLSSAMKGRPYRGICSNMGFTSDLYFKNRGYNFLKLNTGDDDLFIQKIATGDNTSVIVNPNATVRETHYGGLSMWFSERRFYSYAYKYYPLAVKAGIFTELFSRVLFLGAAVAVIAMLIPYVWIAAISMVVLRYTAVFFALSRICARLGEKGIKWAFIIHDFVSPFSETLLSLSRSIRPSRGLWS